MTPTSSHLQHHVDIDTDIDNGSSLNALSLCLPFDCRSAFHPPRAAPGAALFTADCGTEPTVLTNERSIILWGVSRLMAAAAAHPPPDDLAPASEGAGGG